MKCLIWNRTVQYRIVEKRRELFRTGEERRGEERRGEERRGEERTEEENRIGCNIMRYKMTR